MTIIISIISDVATIQEILIKQYEDATRSIPVMPLEDDEGVALSDIYGSVLVEEDTTTTKTTRTSYGQSGNKTLDSMKDMFYVNDKLAKRIFLKGETGHGKTVFCLKAIELWSKSKSSNHSISKENSSNQSKSEENCLNESISEEISLNESIIGENSSSESIGKENPPKSTFRKSQHKKTEYKQSRYEHTECKQSLAMQANDERELEKCLSQFDLVFYVPLRYAKHDESSIVDLVCGSVSGCEKSEKEKIKQMLGEGTISCLVLLDGLDEWRAPSICRVQGFPDSDDLINSTILCTMRPWRMVNLHLRLDSTCDKVVQIFGLKGTSVKAVISNVLVHFYGLQVSSPEYEKLFQRFCENAKHPLLKSLMKIPLMLSTACLIWNEEGDMSPGNVQNAQNFMTFFYLKLIELMISRAEIKNTNVSRFMCEKRERPNLSLRIPGLLPEFSHIVDFLDVITPVGRLALKDLVSEETHLVFAKYQLERDIGQTLVELALKTGILTQAKAPGLSYQQRVSVNFFHKSIQEFMAALVLSCGDDKAFDSLCKHCKTVDKVMELSNMIMFVCGLNPVVGSQLSEHVKCVINADADILQYRDSLCEAPVYYERSQDQKKVEELYKMQCRFFSEMKSSLAHTPDRDQTQNVHTPDIFLDWKSDMEVNEMTKELVSVENNDILSVCLLGGYQNYHYDHGTHIIPNLPKCNDLASLHIRGHDYSDYTVVLQPTLQQLTQLKCLYLSKISLTDYVALNYMPKLQTVTLNRINQGHHIFPSLWLCSQLKEIKLMFMTLIDGVTLANMPLLDTVSLNSVRCAHFMLPSLSGCTNLKSLDIDCPKSMRDRMLLASVLPQLVHLQCIKYRATAHRYGGYDHSGDVAVVAALQTLTNLKRIEIKGISYMARYEDGSEIEFASEEDKENDDSEEMSFIEGEDFDLKYDEDKWQINVLFASDNEEGIENSYSGDISYNANYGVSMYGDKDDYYCDYDINALLGLDTDQCIDNANSEGPSDKRKYNVDCEVDYCEYGGDQAQINRWFDSDDDEEHGDSVSCDDGTLQVTPDMKQLEEMKLTRIRMSARRWSTFVNSLLNVQHTVHVTLCDTDIDTQTVSMIKKSPHFKVSHHSVPFFTDVTFSRMLTPAASNLA